MKTNKEIQQLVSDHITRLKEELSKIRTGRANASLIEDIQVEYYGSRQPIKALGSIRSLDSQTLIVEPWDKSSIDPIASAISKAQNGLSAVPEGERVRIPFPPLSEERRTEFVRLAGHKAEETKVSLRRLRDESMKALQTAEKSGVISEDDKFRQKEDLEEIFKKASQLIEDCKQQKEEELVSK